MKTNQTASNRLHPPAHAGTATGGVGSGLFYAPMKTPIEYEDEIREIKLPSTDLETRVYLNEQGGISICQIDEAGNEEFVSIYSKSRLKTIVAGLLKLSTTATWGEEWN